MQMSGSPGRRAITSAAVAIALLAVVPSASCGNNSAGFDGGADDAAAGAGDTGDDGNGPCVGLSCPPPGGGDDSGLLPWGTDGGGGGGIADASLPPDGGPLVHDGCPGTLSPALSTALKAGGAVDSAMKWLYPYDATVFPAGILPPVLQWSQSAKPDGMYLHLHSNQLDLKYCFPGVNPGQLPLNPQVWATAINLSLGASDPITIELSTSTGGKVSGPIREKWIFARGSLKGPLYYNTYTSHQTNPPNGAVMVIPAGAPKPNVLLTVPNGMAQPIPTGPCISCHSLSADGSMIVAQRHAYPGGLQAPGSMSFSLANGAVVTPATTPTASTTNDDWGFGGVSPNGFFDLTCGEPDQAPSMIGQPGPATFPAGPRNNPAMLGPKSSVLYNVTNGSTVATPGLVKIAMMPMFSPDGKKVVFNDFDNGGGHTLAVMDVNVNVPASTTSIAFSNRKEIFKDANKYPGWPFFTPDGASVVFAFGDSPNFASIPYASFSQVGPVQASATDVTTSDLYIVNVATGASHALDATNGFIKGNSYLPFGTRDEHRNFYETVMPVAAGGYFWVYFTTRRCYGNTLCDQNPPGGVTSSTTLWDSASKKIWIAAININAPAGLDPSHPAFYLPSQEIESGNLRPFSTLTPCKKDGTASSSSCETGIDCCDGSCYNALCQKPPPPPPGPPPCVTENNKCIMTSDCCPCTGTSVGCINGFCACIAPQ